MRVGRHEVAITNPDKVFFPEPGLTKGDLVDYYLAVAPCALHHIRRRPFHMKRYPHGVEGEFFHQKRVPARRMTGVSSAGRSVLHEVILQSPDCSAPR